MSFDCNFIMKLEDACFVSGPTTTFNQEHLVIITEKVENNLDDFIKNYSGDIPEEIVLQLFS